MRLLTEVCAIAVMVMDMLFGVTWHSDHHSALAAANVPSCKWFLFWLDQASTVVAAVTIAIAMLALTCNMLQHPRP